MKLLQMTYCPPPMDINIIVLSSLPVKCQTPYLDSNKPDLSRNGGGVHYTTVFLSSYYIY